MKRGKPLKSKRKRKPSMMAFWVAVTDHGMKPCAFRDVDGCVTMFGVDAHHYVPKRRLPESAQSDPRNGVSLCRWHHEQVENARVVCPRPPELDAFLEDHQLLESGRPIPKRRAA